MYVAQRIQRLSSGIAKEPQKKSKVNNKNAKLKYRMVILEVLKYPECRRATGELAFTYMVDVAQPEAAAQ